VLKACRSPGSKATDMLAFGTTLARENIVRFWHLNTREKVLGTHWLKASYEGAKQNIPLSGSHISTLHSLRWPRYSTYFYTMISIIFCTWCGVTFHCLVSSLSPRDKKSYSKILRNGRCIICCNRLYRFCC